MSESGVPSNSHRKGTSMLIKLRGPQRFETNFEKALLTGHASYLVVQHSYTISGGITNYVIAH